MLVIYESGKPPKIFRSPGEDAVEIKKIREDQEKFEKERQPKYTVNVYK